MKIKKIKLYTNKLDSEKAFYIKHLGLNLVSENDCSFTVKVGWTELTYVKSNQEHIYHYCFLIPSNQLHEALSWFEERVDIIEISKAQKIQHFDTWNADSFYFLDGSGNLAECIVRHDLKNDSHSPFDQKSLLGINEIGLPTKDITLTGAKLSNLIGTDFWKGDLERFGTHGDQEGLFLLPNYKVKGVWFPTNIPIKPEAFTVEVLVALDKTYHLKYLKDDIQMEADD